MRRGNSSAPFAWALLAAGMLLTACAQDAGPFSVQVVQPTGGACQYQLAPARLATLTDLNRMSGQLGSVVRSGKDLSQEDAMVKSGAGFERIDLQFGKGDGYYYALDYDSLFAASLYYSVETGYQITSRLLPEADFVATQPDFAARTLIVQEAKVSKKNSQDQVYDRHDNASYVGVYVNDNDPFSIVRNYMLSYPTQEITNIPLGINLGVMVHEYTHLVMNNLFYAKKRKAGQTFANTVSKNVLGSLDEGIADYFGFMATKDPGYFLCSYPDERRNLADSTNRFDSEYLGRLQTDANIDLHEGGAKWAAANYAIGLQIGFDTNAQAILQMASSLTTCAGGNGTTLTLSFSKIAQCHATAAGSNSGTIRSVYSQWGIQ